MSQLILNKLTISTVITVELIDDLDRSCCSLTTLVKSQRHIRSRFIDSYMYGLALTLLCNATRSPST